MSSSSAAVPTPEPTLNHIINNQGLRWIFVGGKGGVGKTTTSCCLGLQLATKREKVLLISTDPAHNLSDAFGQQFTKEPTKVEGLSNLYCMEIDPEIEREESDKSKISGLLAQAGLDPETMSELASSLPGIDEAMSFAAMLRIIKTLDFSVVIFDTAPTGHTLRLLQFPNTLQKTFEKFMSLRQFSGIFSQISSLMNMPGTDMMSSMDELKNSVEEISTQFKNPELTTFVCVCIPEFLSVYETERLVQELMKMEMDVGSVVVNQVIFPEKDGCCKLCLARRKMQQKYLDEIAELYSLFHVVTLPLLYEEVRGISDLRKFSANLASPYSPQ
eukprot:TRINITY_DN3125_c0_g1_i1.p1 TRINITY_DN3125_c0_g1~~TRINITY_DN3125_c0_g1_i1.p1  ORF type:complete len:343 (+),score=136.98 TRINITY_DN3125_c0_g1_i1:40-1029(+)